uniref:C2h2-type zn-finger protein n=1 Tax=Culex tarsalis TaxID=7177 RepID=A0A1Q3F1F6_CULTA
MNVCRICLCDESVAFDRFLVDIFPSILQQNDENPKFSVPSALQAICGIKLTESDTGPKRICLECRSRLEEALNLRRLALRSQEKLATRSSTGEPASELPGEPSSDVQWIKVEPVMPWLDDAESDDLSHTEQDVGEEEAPPDGLLVCCGCDATFDDERALLKHSKEVHFPGAPVDVPPEKALCRVCYALFVSTQVLEVHWSGKSGGRVVRVCPQCEKRFWSKERYEGHHCSRSREEEESFRCCGCDFQTADESIFKWHSKCHRNAERRVRNEERVKALPILCSICAGRFQTNEELMVHRNEHARVEMTSKPKVNPIELSCCGCLSVYKTAEEVKEHQRQVHAPEREDRVGANEYECGNCYKRFPHQTHLKKHANVRRHFTCSKCPAMRHSVQDMLQHLASHDGPKSYWCCGCRLNRERFDTPEELERHSREVHAAQPKFYHKVANVEEQRPFECKTCFRRYPSEKLLRKHMVVTYAKESYVCDTCGKPFSQSQAFETHLATHRETSDYPCPICSKKFKHETTARACELRHLRQTVDYSCNICGGKFASSSHLKSHLISHSETTPFSCSICGLRFKRKTSLRMHMVYHGSDRNFRCPYCPSQFYTGSTLEKHLIQHTGIYPYECDFPGCGAKFRPRLKYIQHFEEAHMADSARLFRCHLCEQRFSRDHFLSNHLKYAHQIEPQDRGWRGKFKRKSQPRVGPSGGGPAAPEGTVEEGEDDDDEEMAEAVGYIR